MGAVGGPSFAVTTFSAKISITCSDCVGACIEDTYGAQRWTTDFLVRWSNLGSESKAPESICCVQTDSAENDCSTMGFEESLKLGAGWDVVQRILRIIASRWWSVYSREQQRFWEGWGR